MPFTTNGQPISKYNGTQGFYDAYNAISKGRAANEGDIQNLERYGDQFTTMFRNLVGRDPQSGEVGQFFSGVVAGGGNFSDPQILRDRTASFIGDTYQQAAQEVAQEKLKGQEAEAMRLSDLFRQQGNQAINTAEQSLLDYQSRLFERLRPNLITSLQSQGLLNTGGLNTAVAGAQGDLANSVSQSLLDQRLANDQQANAIAFGGASAPYEFQRSQIMNQPSYLQSQGQNALNNSFQTFLTNLNFQNQLALQRDARGGGKGGFFRSLGTALPGMLNNMVGQFGTSVKQGGTTNTGTGLMSLFA